MPLREAHLRRYQVTIAFALIVLSLVLAFNTRDTALDKVREQSTATDRALCEQQRVGIGTLRDLLLDVRNFAYENTPPKERDETFNKAIKFYDMRINDLERPIPCEEELDI